MRCLTASSQSFGHELFLVLLVVAIIIVNQAVASKLNDSLKRKAAMVRLAEVQHMVVPPQQLVEPGRRLIRDGALLRVHDVGGAVGATQEQ